ncbi:sigma-54 interaction domain-containing protein [Paenibacillus sp. Soil724D2]|uniref:sigma-54 interaction domain-containing protein n=1 Tax=Paenibacillus sp. (strain Soil724D2) TaxID=1736392 RepID=UPI0007149A0A|nr:sigma 54-interacting transcriptional regulator [Paenibacillus sp. Soil724D2]KRE32757.1 histidine kinase [Paenibacillus sp. Soil724D2]
MKHKVPLIEDLIQINYYFIEKDADTEARFEQYTSSLQPNQKKVLFYKDGFQLFYYVGEHPANRLSLMNVPWRTAVSVPQKTPLDAVIPLFRETDYILVKDAADQPIGYVTAADMLTALHQAHQTLKAYFESMIDTMDASISMIDDQERTVVWTKGAERIFSIKADDILSKPMADFFPADRLQILQTHKTGDSVFRKLHQPRPDLYVLINSNPIRLNGQIIGSVVAETDITSEVRLNQELFNATSKVHQLQQQMAQLQPSTDPFSPIKGTSSAIKRTIDMCKKIGTTKATVLILGETGVGKELFAKAIHDVREKPDAPFIAINCGAISPSLFESELFGYEKGAFSGADNNGKKGKIQLAAGGTLFLDEIGEMPLDMQVKLLRVLQERTYFPVGGTKQLKADIRIIAATNRDLNAQVKQGLFREDLYYRLNVVTIEIPPLRERKEDIIELTHCFLNEFSISYSRFIQHVPQDVLLDLLHYSWPGNIRELRNAIERLVVFAADGSVKRDDLPMSIHVSKHRDDSPLQEETPNVIQTLQKELEVHEKQIIIKALELEKGNKLAAAKRLGLSRATLYNKMNKLGFDE